MDFKIYESLLYLKISNAKYLDKLFYTFEIIPVTFAWK